MKLETKKKIKYATIVGMILTFFIVGTVLIIYFCVIAKDKTVKDGEIEKQKKGVPEIKSITPTRIEEKPINPSQIKPTKASETKPTKNKETKPTKIDKDPIDAKLDSHQRFWRNFRIKDEFSFTREQWDNEIYVM